VESSAQTLTGTLSAVANGTVLPPTPTTVTISDPGGLATSRLLGRKLLLSDGNGAGQSRFVVGAVDNGSTFTLTLDRPYAAIDVPNTSSQYILSIDDALVGR